LETKLRKKASLLVNAPFLFTCCRESSADIFLECERIGLLKDLLKVNSINR